LSPAVPRNPVEMAIAGTVTNSTYRTSLMMYSPFLICRVAPPCTYYVQVTPAVPRRRRWKTTPAVSCRTEWRDEQV
jgi:hypothetical protein